MIAGLTWKKGNRITDILFKDVSTSLAPEVITWHLLFPPYLLTLGHDLDREMGHRGIV